MLSVFVWAPDRTTFVRAMTTLRFAQLTPEGELIWHNNLSVDEIGTVFHEEKPLSGYYVSVAAHGDLEQKLTLGVDLTDEEGELINLFDRTNIRSIIPGLKSIDSGKIAEDVPGGLIGPHGIILIDPDTIEKPRVWL